MSHKTIFRIITLSSAAAAAFLATPAAAAADGPVEQILIGASRGTAPPLNLIGTSFTIIAPEDIETRQTQFVSDLLRDVPGVEVSRTGAAGGLTTVRIRGSEGNHTLVMIDGMEASDPFQGEFDFSGLLADEAVRVEVLRGQQSALYGSDAIGGVIHYITTTGAEAPGFRARLDGGSFGTGQATARLAGVNGPLDFALSGNYFTSDGVPNARGGTRKLSTEAGSGAGKTIFTITDALSITGVLRYEKSRVETNPQSFFPCPGPTCGLAIDGDSYFDATSRYGLLRADLSLLEGAWTHAATLQANDARRENFDGGFVSFHGYGSRWKGSYVTSYAFGSQMMAHRLTFAADHKSEDYENVATGIPGPANEVRNLTNTGIVGEYFLNLGGRTGIGGALRHDWNEHFHNATTFRLQASHLFDSGTRVRAAAGSGIKNPTNFELFGFDPTSFIGNPDLKPEKSTGYEAGIEQSFLMGQVLVGATYFDSTLEDEIFTAFLPGFVATVENRTTNSEQQGVELFIQALIGQSWRVFGSYTYLDATENGDREIRRAPHIASLNIAWRAPDDRFGANMTVRYTGEQEDSNFGTGERVTLSSFTLINLGADWRIAEWVQFYGRIENALDEEYEEVFSFRSSGRAAYAGVRLAM